jgi:hypothetical protein
LTINQSFVNPSVTKKPYCREDLGKSRLIRVLALINVFKKAMKVRQNPARGEALYVGEQNAQ